MFVLAGHGLVSDCAVDVHHCRTDRDPVCCLNSDLCICYVTLEAENYYYETETTPLYHMAVRYEFGAYFNGNPQSINAKTDVRVRFNIPAESFINGMTVNVTLDGFVPNDDKLSYALPMCDESRLCVTNEENHKKKKNCNKKKKNLQ